MSAEIKITTKEKAQKTAELRAYHKATLDKIGYDVAYLPKLCYKPKIKDGLHISFFPSELRAGVDLYTEFISKDYDSEDQTRTLYKWAYNPNWEDIYTAVTKAGSNIVSYYLVPVTDLIPIERVVESEGIDETVLELGDPDLDLPLDQMSMRDLFAILHKQPVSQKKWLNQLINKTK